MTKSSIQFAAVGDVSLGDHPLCVGFGGYSEFRKNDATFPFEHVKSVFANSDLVFGNLECTLSNANRSSGDYSSIQMRGHPDSCTGLAESGFDVMNLANNHSLQHGKDAFQDTVRMLSANNIQTTGVNTGDHLVGTPTIINKNGLRVAFLGYSLRPRQYFDYAPDYSEGHGDGIANDIRMVRDDVDIVIVSLHWGDEFIQRPSPEEIQLGRRLIDEGANLIVGHHPHVLRGVEKYNDGYIAYSLGNFVCDMIWDDTTRETAVLQCELSENGVHDVRLLPCYINDHYQPIVLDGEKADSLRDKISRLSREIEAESLSDIRAKTLAYVQEADDKHRYIRARSHRYFLRRIWQYPPSILLQQIWRFIVNRLHEITHRKEQAST